LYDGNEFLIMYFIDLNDLHRLSITILFQILFTIILKNKKKKKKERE